MATEKDFKIKNGAIVGTTVTFESATSGGVLSWNTLESTLNITLNDQVTLQTGQEQLFYGKATEAISNGDIVMFAGAQGDHLLIAKADTQSVGFQPEYVIGVATQDFNINDFGFVTSFGKVRELDTSLLPEGTIIYLDPTTPGGWITTPPANGVHVIQIAAVVNQHAIQGTIFVRPLHKPHLDEIQGVNITNLQNGQVLIWNASNNAWENGDYQAVSSIDDLTDVDITTTAPTNGQALVWNGTNFVPGDVAVDTTFVGLTDSPSSYTGNAGRAVKVNATETGVDFGDIIIGATTREFFTGDGTTTNFTLANQYAGENGFLLFVDGVVQKVGEDYTYSGTTLAFTTAPINSAEIFVYGTTPIAQNVPGDGTVTANKLAVSAYTRDLFSGNGSTTAFTLTRDPGSVYAPFIFVDGVIQDPITHYTVSGTTLTFTFAPATGTNNILVVYGPTFTAGTVSDGSITFAKLSPTNFLSQVETGDGTTTDFALDQQAVSEGHIIVTVASVPQSPDGTTYTLINNGNTISFASAPANGAKIVIRWYGVATYTVPVDNSVSTAKIQNSAVTSDKIADGSITAAKIADGTIVAAEIADGTITPVKLDREYATKGTSIALSIALG